MAKDEIHPTHSRILQDAQANKREEMRRMHRFNKLDNEQKRQVLKQPALQSGLEKSSRTLDALTAHGAGKLYGHR